MTKVDPIIAVKDVNESARWYQLVFGCIRKHEGDDFAVLLNENNEVSICLHKWGQDNHPTMINPKDTKGNGLILYFKTDNLSAIRQNVKNMGYPVEEDIHLNPNSRRMEFSLRDNDGYFWTISEYHEYEG